MSEKSLGESILFAKDAADYLGISVQRLNQLVHDNKIIPLKKTSAGTIFLIKELEKRKLESALFSQSIKTDGKPTGFSINSKIRQEAVNYSCLIEALKQTESTVEPIFDEISQIVDVSLPLIDKLNEYCKYFKVNSNELTRTYEHVVSCFMRLKPSDHVIKRGNEHYSALLSKTSNAPRFLYARGNIELLNNRIVSVVGTRNPSDIGIERAYKLSQLLGINGVTVASGLARGIDSAAHRAALDFGFNTISVIGTDLNRYYPPENTDMQKEIEKKGLIISQFNPASVVQRWHFPLRNAVMSGISLATIVIEAGETSGALKQADFALKQQRLVLIPQSAIDNPKITWPKKYALREGARIVKGIDDIIKNLAEYKIYSTEEREQPQKKNQLSFFEE